MSEEQILIDEFEKNSAEVIQTSISEFKGKQYIDFRVWTSGAAGDFGERKPTMKGLTISVEILPDLLMSVQLAITHIRHGKEDVESDAVSDFPE